MPFDFQAVKSINEFYSDHFLEAVFEGEFVKGLAAKWEGEEEETGKKGPHKRLGGLTSDFFKAKARYANAQMDEDRLIETHRINVALAEALGYEPRQRHFELIAAEEGKGSYALPVLSTVERDGNPYLWIVESWFVDENDSAFDRRPLSGQLPAENLQYIVSPYRWEETFSAIFRKDDPPRWVLFLAGNKAVLAERHKWGQGKYLLFDIEHVMDAKRDAARLVAAFLSKDALAPDGAAVLHDQIDEKSHKHAFGVSEDLKEGLRKAVEVLANEYVYDRRYRQKLATFSEGDALAQTLKEECLRYLYRLLFLFYAEARAGELGIIPMNSDEYREGYSLETLRDLELVPLTTTEAQDGYFIDDSLRLLFKIVNDGFQPLGDASLLDRDTTLNAGFTVQGLHSPLFDMDATTPTLAKAKFRNTALQEILQLLSLSKPSRKKGRGRISYAQLGINQLGAVYEGILSYSGFFAKETLYEVRAADSKDDDQSYFVPESEIGDYRANEFVMVPDPAHEERKLRKRYEKGTFIFRLAGRDRTSSASYYTPEVLTKCVVKYALKELLNPREREPLAAEEILNLTVLEPAVGSGAFLNEAVNQLADAYLERRQRELERTVPPSEYAHERQRVKAYLAANNCYGVDLNPIAAELAKVSLWLNTLYEGSATPWYGLRIAEGNSLIGCRRQVWKAKDVRDGTYRKVVPTRLALGPEWEKRPKDGIYHFLLPDDGMCDYGGDKVVKELAKDHLERIKEWKKEFVAAKWQDDDVVKLGELSGLVDELWQQVIKERREAAKRCRLPRNVWGMDPEAGDAKMPEAQERIAVELDEPYKASRRLKLLMDYWCSLWFWPIEQADRLPSREMWLMHLEMILKGTTRGIGPNQKELAFEGVDTPEERDFVNRHGHVDVDEYVGDGRFPFHIAHGVAQTMRFHHWELRFAELFATRGGFDLVVGNPPWVELTWEESTYLADVYPTIGVRKMSANETSSVRPSLMKHQAILDGYLADFVKTAGAKSFLNCLQQYRDLSGQKTNTFKNFVVRALDSTSANGFCGLLHPDSLYDSSNGGELREALYQRLYFHAHFTNVLSLFAGTNDHGLLEYSINIYGPGRSSFSFYNISNVFHPNTIDESLSHDGSGSVPGLRDQEGGWALRGHSSRLVKCDEAMLHIFASLFDKPGTPSRRAKLPQLHSVEMVEVIKKFLMTSARFGDIRDRLFTSGMWHETDEQGAGTIRRETRFPERVGELILSGPHIYCNNPLYKTPRQICTESGHYSKIDLTSISSEYLPRTNYVPSCSPSEYLGRQPTFEGRPLTTFYRHVNREMVNATKERTLTGAIIPPGVSHVNTVFSVASKNVLDILLLTGACSSIVFDFFIKVTGAGHVNVSQIYQLPIPVMKNPLAAEFYERVLRLNCLTGHYKELLKQSLHECPALFDGNISWTPDFPLRTDASRLAAQCEIDSIVALCLGLDADDLVTIYRVQFPVLAKNDRATVFDINERIVPSEVLKFVQSMQLRQSEPIDPTVVRYAGKPVDTDLVGISKGRGRAKAPIGADAPRLVVTNHPTLGEVGAIAWTDPRMEPREERLYVAPFVRFDREEDMRAAYRRFAHLSGGKEAKV